MASFFSSTPALFNKLVKQVSESAESVAESLKETATRTHKEFLQEHDRYMVEQEDRPVLDQLPWEQFEPQVAKSVQERVLALSESDRCFLTPVPGGSDFFFDYEEHTVVILKLLDIDPRIGKIRFKIVPRLVKEDVFWKNYFFQISKIVEGYGGSSRTLPGGEDKLNDALRSARAYEQALDAALDDGDNLNMIDSGDDDFLFASEESGQIVEERNIKESPVESTKSTDSATNKAKDEGPLPSPVAPGPEDEWEKELELELKGSCTVNDNDEMGSIESAGFVNISSQNTAESVKGDFESDLEEQLEAELGL
jgi:hypothetical protein